MLGESLLITSEYFTQEAKVVSHTSRMEALEAKNSTLKKNLIDSMGKATNLKEKVKTLSDDLRVERHLTLEKDEQLLGAKEKLKTIAARFVEAFQTTDEYNTVLFSWYFKGFELLRRYPAKHPSRVNLEKLDLEEVDQEMVADEAAQSFATETDAPRLPPLVMPLLVMTLLLMPESDTYEDFLVFCFCMPILFWVFCKSNFKTVSF